MLLNIIVPTDFSPHADMALEHAIEFAKRFSAKIHLLHAYPIMLVARYPDQFALPTDLVATVRAAAREQLEPREKRAAAAGVQCQSHLSDSAPVTAILDLVNEVQGELIIMGTRGLTGLKHAVLGSVAERVVRLATCPVMTVKGGAE